MKISFWKIYFVALNVVLGAIFLISASKIQNILKINIGKIEKKIHLKNLDNFSETVRKALMSGDFFLLKSSVNTIINSKTFEAISISDEKNKKIVCLAIKKTCNEYIGKKNFFQKEIFYDEKSNQKMGLIKAYYKHSILNTIKLRL